jgi:uncharacterized protein
MELKLSNKPSGVTIIEGFPGLGLIGTICTEYLIKHLKAKTIGHIKLVDIAPIAAIHGGVIVQPLEIYYVKSHNIIILHSLVDGMGMEWKVSGALAALYKDLKAKEIITIEGMLGQEQKPKVINAYHYSKKLENSKLLAKSGAQVLHEGILMGVTASLLLDDSKMNITGIFVETNSKMPDSMASAKVIEVLNGYLKLKIDPKPLKQAASDFEAKLQGYMDKLKETAETVKEKKTHEDYFG